MNASTSATVMGAAQFGSMIFTLPLSVPNLRAGLQGLFRRRQIRNRPIIARDCNGLAPLDGFQQLGQVCPRIGGGDIHPIIVQQCCTIMIPRLRGRRRHNPPERGSNSPGYLYPRSSREWAIPWPGRPAPALKTGQCLLEDRPEPPWANTAAPGGEKRRDQR